MATQIFCPKCGEELVANPDRGYLECIPGQMPLSAELEKRLRECYIECTRNPVDRIFTYNDKPHGIGGQWFCPGCAEEMTEMTPGDLRCPECNRSLFEFVYSLVERHPHKSKDGKGGVDRRAEQLAPADNTCTSLRHCRLQSV